MIHPLLLQVADTVRDSAVVHTPLPGGVGAVVRWLFNVPTWIQIGGAVLGMVVAIALAWVIWTRRAAIVAWLTAQSRGAKIGLAAVAAVLVLAFSAFGAVSWHYMQHNNDFCQGCHVMTGAYTRFQHSEHHKLQCHDCHQQSLFASMRQLVLWVAEKPQAIPPHAKVPNDVCARCHIQGPGQDSVWKRIIATAGHRVHLNSDSASLKNLQCTKCHGQEVHHFVPVDSTCGQASCHQSVKIKLAKMSGQTSLHCVKCHQFTRGVSEVISLDSTRKFLVPAKNECLGCHEMRQRLGDYDEVRDPHQGVCGACHDPHKQSTPQAAWATCAKAGCHAKAETLSPFHKGLAPKALAECKSCHQAHTWSVKGDKCLRCHQTIFEDRPPGVRPAAGITPAKLTAGGQGTGKGYTGSEAFSHKRHKKLACTSCHATGKEHGALNVHTVRDCQSCHHASPLATPQGAVSGFPSRLCTSCHQGVGLRQGIQDTVSLKLTVWKEPRIRVLDFRHAHHAFPEAGCTACHTTPVTLSTPPEKSCNSCHAEHHEPDVQCRNCHVTAKAVHTREVHVGCTGSQCHALQTVQGLQAKRNVCLVCHQTMVNHKPGKECAACHQVQWLTAQKGTI